MMVYTLMGDTDYEGQTLLGVFASKQDMLDYVKAEAAGLSHRPRPQLLGYDGLGYVLAELGKPVDFHADVVWLE